MTSAPTPPSRVRTAYVDWLLERLVERDRSVVEMVNLLRIASGPQLERLCFADVAAGRSRTVVRSRVLGRLVSARVLMPVGRRIGGGRGSTAEAFVLDSAGQKLVERWQLADGARPRVRRPGPPSERRLRHLLAGSELYADLVDAARSEDGASVAVFKAEPACWWPNGLGGWLKPDDYAVLTRAGVRDHRWLEVDQATESLPTLRGKLQAYLDFQQRGERGPEGTVPWVLVSTVTEQRRDAVAADLRKLPGAADLIRVAHCRDSAWHMLKVLRE